ncbi:hypothetical protein L202_02584 [Cryptococcus amylolentus CBS 6039]|uniref:Uncharacterized protein n=2 Tax=Cryptococcus amylolentus TaxID=104669 RepID=A0A1E3I321_9TREE|nr:hypothetical protein L202_02584 [Cryptococcus amylolentus CBS 6039]ODN82306.1 hypothetical protein L202_02584 [Cryptococcus amylolentus CBS 6039]ODO09625.1 hypothetical protein I350_01836 [Cryptococcus amylolentus CBS 6273]
MSTEVPSSASAATAPTFASLTEEENETIKMAFDLSSNLLQASGTQISSLTNYMAPLLAGQIFNGDNVENEQLRLILRGYKSGKEAFGELEGLREEIRRIDEKTGRALSSCWGSRVADSVNEATKDDSDSWDSDSESTSDDVDKDERVPRKRRRYDPALTSSTSGPVYSV